MKKKLTHITFIYLTLVGFISPVSVYSSSVSNMESSPATTYIAHKHKSPNTNRTALTEKDTSAEKKILINDSRGLSAFFILGIIINIIMIITFGWWFSKEWRRQK